MSHGHTALGESSPQSVFYEQGRFGRLFPALPAFAADTALMRDALTELGAKKGPMDADDDLSDPITLITDPAKSANNPNNPTMTAGFTFLGQFAELPGQLRNERQRPSPAVLRPDLRPGRGRCERSGRPPGRTTSAAALHRLADVL